MLVPPSTPPLCCRLLLGALLLLVAGCRGEPLSEAQARAEWSRVSRTLNRLHADPSPDQVPKRAPRRARLELSWDPASGRGEVRQLFSDRSVLTSCFQCRYPGFAGGLVFGSYGGAGYTLVQPSRRGKGQPKVRRLTLFASLDESIWDRDEAQEYSFGWSENYGSPTDGVTLRYLGGRIAEDSDEALVLLSENRAGCYRVRKVAITRPAALHWVIATRVENACQRPLRFDFFVGDDPWVGQYRAAAGDVGWRPGALLPVETALDPAGFTWFGLLDRPDPTADPGADPCSGGANALGRDPTLPPPDRVLLGNRFAHRAAELKPKAPLDRHSRNALNLGWKGRTLAPGQGLTIALAFGQARAGTPKTPPRAPAVPAADWARWRRYLPAGPEPAPTPVPWRVEPAARRSASSPATKGAR